MLGRVTTTSSLEPVAAAFAQARELPSLERSGYLATLHRSDPDLHREIDSLLAADTTRVERLFSTLRDAAADEPPSIGPRIPGYSLLSVIGEGGFGTVYFATQAVPMRRCVAIKVLRHAADARRAVARFRDETQALASLDHPSIVRVLECGTTSEGTPYLVMPLIAGESICRFATAARLDARRIAALMERVVRGVEHAHGNAILHRDLKPANILVAEVDGTPMPRIIDFGLAKALGPALTPHSTLTIDGQRMGTVQYMSPEQFRGEPVDARGDVYALGLILYELLAGGAAIDASRAELAFCQQPMPDLHAAPFAPPSSRAGKPVPRELEWITLRCLARDPAERYATAAALGDDLRAFLAGDAVKAGPPARLFRLYAWIRRRRSLVASLAVVVLSLAAIAAVSVVTARRERVARENAQQVTRFAESILGGLDPLLAQGRDRTLVVEALRRASLSIDGAKYSPEVRLQVLTLLTRAYLNIGEKTPAFRYASEAKTLAEQLYPPDDPRRAWAVVRYVQALVDMGNWQVVAAQHVPDRGAIFNMVMRVFPRGSRDRGEALVALGALAWDNDAKDRDAMLAQMYDDARVQFGEGDRLTIRLARLRAFRTQSKDPHGALDLVMNARKSAMASLGPNDPDSHAGLAIETYMLWRTAGDAAAERHIVAYLPEAERLLGRLHRTILMSWYNRGNALVTLGRLDEAEPAVHETIARCKEALGTHSGLLAWAMLDLYRIHLLRHDLIKADAVMAELISLGRSAGAPGADVPEVGLDVDGIKKLIDALRAVRRDDRVEIILQRVAEERPEYLPLLQ